VATVSIAYGTYVAPAVTALQSMASSQTVGWKSALVDNTSTLALDYEIYVKLTTANTAPANDKAMYVYLASAIKDGGSTFQYADGGTTTLPTSGDAAYTIAIPNDLTLLGVLSYTTQNMTVENTWLLSSAFGQSIPEGFLIVIVNYSGAALSTGCVVGVKPINNTVV
jgi:hypothetical protein